VRKHQSEQDTEPPESERIYRHWVEIRDLQTGVVRELALRALVKIPLTKVPLPREDVLELQDDTTTLEAQNLQDLANQLRTRYPDGLYERTLHNERDREAEKQRQKAFNSLIDLLAEYVVRDGCDR